jgi:hypothetical protein
MPIIQQETQNNPINLGKQSVTYINRELTQLKIKANPNDRTLFQFLYCVECADFITVGALLPNADREHAKHTLAWLPSLDEPSPGVQIDHIGNWLEQTPLEDERRHWLAAVAKTTNSLNFAWVVTGAEYESWDIYLESYLEEITEGWLSALNGHASRYLSTEMVWGTTQPLIYSFEWNDFRSIE